MAKGNEAQEEIREFLARKCLILMFFQKLPPSERYVTRITRKPLKSACFRELVVEEKMQEEDEAKKEQTKHHCRYISRP